MCFFIYQFVFVPVNIISLDINPSIELGVNRMGYVIDAKAYNEDGEILLDNVDVGYKKYMLFPFFVLKTTMPVGKVI